MVHSDEGQDRSCSLEMFNCPDEQRKASMPLLISFSRASLVVPLRHNIIGVELEHPPCTRNYISLPVPHIYLTPSRSSLHLNLCALPLLFVL